MNLQTRLEKLTERVHSLSVEPMQFVYTLPSGEQKTGTLDDMCADNGVFVRCVDGASLRGLDDFFALIDSECGGYGDIARRGADV